MIALHPFNFQEKSTDLQVANLENYNSNLLDEYNSEYIIKFSEEIDLKKGVGLVPMPASNPELKKHENSG